MVKFITNKTIDFELGGIFTISLTENGLISMPIDTQTFGNGHVEVEQAMDEFGEIIYIERK